jgi:hypothetical protein
LAPWRPELKSGRCQDTAVHFDGFAANSVRSHFICAEPADEATSLFSEIPPRGFLAQADRRFEILTEFSRDLERDPLERGLFHADAAVLPFGLRRIETQCRRRLS